MSNLDALGRHADGAAVARRLLSLAEAAYPDAHPQKASALMEVGYHAIRDGDSAGGRQTLEAGIAMARALDSPLELLGWRLLARALAATEDWAALAATAAEDARAAKRSGSHRRAAASRSRRWG